MQELIQTSRALLATHTQLPFTVYSSIREQQVINIPVSKPLLICILNGCKKVGKSDPLTCSAGTFLFLANKPTLDIRNIPLDTEYVALIMEFEYSDFDCFNKKSLCQADLFRGPIDVTLKTALLQFMEWSALAPQALWALRRQEILQLMHHLGYQQVSAIVAPPSLSHRVQNILSANLSAEMGMQEIALQLGMSESTLRRRLAAEQDSLQDIKTRTRLGYGLHLVQTTFDPIGHIAELCGYQSQSRFTDKFKSLFGVTPSELRKTRLSDLGE